MAAFLALSLGAHVAAFAAARWGRPLAPPAPVFQPPEQAITLAGDTLDVDPAATPPPVAPDEVPEEAPPPQPPSLAPAPTPPHAPAPAHAPTPTPTPAHAPAPAPPPPLFGAVGARLATDLATSFTRALPQVASADPAWSSVRLGSTSSATVTLVLDDDGHLAERTIAGAPSEALRRGIDRTLVLLGAREFTARSATTRLRVTARVSRDEVHDGLHGDVFALSGGSFAGEVGMAFFALPAGPGPGTAPGRRVDVELRLVP